MTNISVLKDEALGGVEREYCEVSRKAMVGDGIRIYFSEECEIPAGTIAKCTEAWFDDGSIDVDFPSETYGNYSFLDADCDKWAVLEPTDIVRINGARYRMVERKANVGDRVLITNAVDDAKYDYGYGNGEVHEIREIVSGDPDIWPDGMPDSAIFLIDDEYRVLEPLAAAKSSQPPADSTIDGLLATVANLSVRVAELERRLENRMSPQPAPLSESDTAALDRALKSEPVSDRDAIVERAKADVAELERIGNDSDARLPAESSFSRGFYGVEFVVNRDKQTVVALIKARRSSWIRARGIAKCAPGDVFNSHIGRAISLRRALGLEVPAEYLNAPQPTETRVGDIVKGKYSGNMAKVDWLDDHGRARGYYEDGDSLFAPFGHLNIIDDSRSRR